MAPIEDWPDAKLLAAVTRDDGAAFAVFYRRHLPAVVAFVLRESGDREAAADLSAEVFAAVLLSAARYRGEGDSALPWVLGIARNKLRMSRRRKRIERRARLRLGITPVALDDDDLDLVERLADDGALGVSALVDQLREPERDAVRSRIVLQRSYSEIASELQCSELVVRKRVSRGLARVRKELEQR